MAFIAGEQHGDTSQPSAHKQNDTNYLPLTPSSSPNTVPSSVSTNRQDSTREYQSEGVADSRSPVPYLNANQPTCKKRSFQTFDADSNRSHNQPGTAIHETYNAQSTPIKKQKTSDSNVWSCVLCTLENRMSDRRCQVCQAPKPDAHSNSNSIINNQQHPPPTSEHKSSVVECKNTEDNNSNISTLINGLKKFQINANAKKHAHQASSPEHSNTNNSDTSNNHVDDRAADDALNSMDGLIGQLQGFQFDKAANSALGSNSKMNDIIHTLSSLDINQSNQQDIDNMVKGINAEIHRFILDLQNSLYWRFKIKNEEKKFRKLGRHTKASIDRIIQILTFYHDNHHEEFSLFEYVIDDDSHYKHLSTDYKLVITDNIISSNNLIRMRAPFGLITDYVSQNLPKCNQAGSCPIYQRYHDEEEEDDDVLDDDVKYFRKTMDIIHAYFFHADRCGIMVEQDEKQKDEEGQCAQQPQHLEAGGKWYWFYDDADVKWIPYRDEHQKQLNNAWMNHEKTCVIGGKYEIRFKRSSTNRYPSGTQHDCHQQNSWRRAIIYGVEDRDGLLNGMICQKQPL